MLNIVIGTVFIVGGLSGRLTFIGTNSPRALAAVGVLILGIGLYQAWTSRDEPS